MESFRHCPGCGRRFHIKLETKKLLSSHEESVHRYETEAAGVHGGGAAARGFASPAVTPLTMIEGKPLIVDVEEFQYMYKCGHCDHEWLV